MHCLLYSSRSLLFKERNGILNVSLDIWRTQDNGILLAEDKDIRLAVTKVDGHFHYSVTRLVREGSSCHLLAEGRKQGVRDAMKAALEATRAIFDPAASSSPNPAEDGG